MKSIFLALSLFLTASAQSQEGVHKKYGSPISETFPIRPGIFLTVQYAETGQVCEMIVHSQLLTSDLNFPSTKTITSKTLAEIIEDIAPKAERGKYVIGTFLDMQCPPLNNCDGVKEDYERVTIWRTGGVDKERYARIRWKGIACRQ
jgi:hypothetical protein